MLALEPILRLAAVRIALLVTAIAPNIIAQTANTKAIPASEILQMTAAQPDHIGDISIIVNGTVRAKWKFAKKQNKVRKEMYRANNEDLPGEVHRDYRIVTISEHRQATPPVNTSALNLLLAPTPQKVRPSLAFDPRARTYAELPHNVEYARLDLYNFLDRITSETSAVKIEELGTVVIDGHEARKIKVEFKRQEGERILREQGEVFLYYAKDLKNLLIKLELEYVGQYEVGEAPAFSQARHFVYTLSKISLAVPDDLFNLPEGYRKLEFDEFLASIKLLR
jgi:hypothetical protein